ncbi:MAG: acetyltransferase [Candidatus Cloacimonadia bacterium]
MLKQVAIYGAGGFGREVAWLIESCNRKKTCYEIVCFIDDDASLHGKVLNGIRVLGLDDVRRTHPSVDLVRGLGSISASRAIVRKAESVGLHFLTIIHPDTEYSQYVNIGDGTIICAGNIITTNITIGRYVQVNLDCTIGHDVLIGDHTTLAPGVHISGYVHIGKGVYIGTGAVIINGTEDNPITIGDNVVIGAGACVTKSIQSNTKVVGVPAKSIQYKDS